MDESPRQLIGETRCPVPARPDNRARVDYEYVRYGVCNVFMAVEPLRGERLVCVTERKTKRDWARFLQDIESLCPDAARITLVMDNLNTHGPGSLYETFDPPLAKALWGRFEFINTPKHRSWPNMAEIELNVLHRQCLDRRIGSIDMMRNEVAAWEASRNNKNAVIDWQFSTADALLKIK